MRGLRRASGTDVRGARDVEKNILRKTGILLLGCWWEGKIAGDVRNAAIFRGTARRLVAPAAQQASKTFYKHLRLRIRRRKKKVETSVVAEQRRRGFFLGYFPRPLGFLKRHGYSAAGRASNKKV